MDVAKGSLVKNYQQTVQ